MTAQTPCRVCRIRGEQRRRAGRFFAAQAVVSVVIVWIASRGSWLAAVLLAGLYVWLLYRDWMPRYRQWRGEHTHEDGTVGRGAPR